MKFILLPLWRINQSMGEGTKVPSFIMVNCKNEPETNYN